MNGLESLPEDVQKIIFSYAFKCKKKQNFYINKELFMFWVHRPSGTSTCANTCC